MPKALTKAALAGLACFATVAAGTISPAASTAAHQTSPTHKVAVSKFAYNANSYGTKIVVNGVEVRSLKDALINLPCTRRTGVSQTKDSLVSTAILPEDVREIVDLSLSRSTNESYKTDTRNGVRAINTLANVSLGGTVAGVTTPKVVIKGLQSVADSFHDNKSGKFGHAESFTYQGLGLELPEDNPISDSLGTLLDALGVSEDDIPEVVNVPVATLVDVLVDVAGGTLVIPGLGTVSLGNSSGAVTKNGARAEAYALKITLANEQLGLTPTTLQLGRAQSIIGNIAPAGVFRSKMTALEANIGGLVRLGGIGQRSVPCEGTEGKVLTQSVASAGVPQVLDLKGIEYKYKGLQQGKKATGFVQTTIGQVDLKVADIVLKGITSRVDLSSLAPNKRVQSKATTKIGELVVNGEAVDVRKLIKGITFTDSTGQEGFLQSNVLSAGSNGKKSFFGKQLTGLRITLPGTNSVIDLAVANGEVFFR